MKDDEGPERFKAAFEREMKEKRRIEAELIANSKASLAELEELLGKSSSHWGYEDPIYRFYHASFKVYGLQHQTETIVARLQGLLPGRALSTWFMEIVGDGTGKTWKHEDNENWTRVTRPILEAFFHARFMLEMVIKYGKELDAPPETLPSGWAAVLYLYGLR